MQGSSAKLLGKLGPKVNRFERAPSGTSGITSIDVAHALGCNRNSAQALLLRVKWAGDASSIAPLVEVLTKSLVVRARRQKWILRKPDTIKRAVIMALREREVIRPRRVLTSIDSPYECGAEKCRACRGTGRRYSRRQGKDINCERCDITIEKGVVTSRRRWSDAERASHCGLHRQNWNDGWARRYLDVVEWLKQMEGRALRMIWVITADTKVDMVERTR